MKTTFYSDNGAPCWRCSCTVYTYTVDDCVSYVGATCFACRADNMFFPPSHCTLDAAANISAAHRESDFLLSCEDAENMAAEAADKAERRKP
jgi:hypothetical protein